MAGVFLSMGRVLPDRYPVDDAIENYLDEEHTFGRLLDYTVIGPRLQLLYEWSARELGHPELATLVSDGTPVYAWSAADRREWEAPKLSLAARGLRAVTSVDRLRGGK